MIYYQEKDITIINGGCLTELKKLPPESINCAITSPPYWALRDYGTATWEGGKEDCGHIEPSGSIKFAGRDTQAHTKRQYKDICKKCGAKRIDLQLGLEPTFQEYVAKLCDIFDEVKRVLRKDGTIWVNMGDTYLAQQGKGFPGTGQVNIPDRDKNAVLNIKRPRSIPQKCLAQIPSRFSIEMCNRGWILRNTLIWHKPNCMPSSVKDRFTVDFEYVFFFVKNKKYWFDTQFEEHTSTRWGGTSDSKCKEGKYALPNYKKGVRSHKHDYPKQGRNKRCVWKITTKPFKEAHFAVFPEKLVDTPIKAGCPTDGTVLDPFCGSGTTGVVAKKLNRKFVGIELNQNYCEIAKKRTQGITPSLF